MMNKSDDSYHDMFCIKPFSNIEIDEQGDVWVCCGDWLPTPIGNLKDSGLMEIWNSKMAQKIRLSILDGTFSYCDKSICPDLVKMTLPRKKELNFEHALLHKLEHQLNGEYSLLHILEHHTTFLENGPCMVNLGYDQTCNLRCITCRPKIINYQGDRLYQAQMFQEKYLAEGLENTKYLFITGYGDPFASRLYRSLLRSLSSEKYPNLHIYLLTNGLLLTPDMWASLKSIQSRINGLSVSVDAANDSTYRIIRGGDFSKLYRNLEFMSQLNKSDDIETLQLSFIVQSGNFREMKDFVRLGLSLNCTEVLFQKLIHWKSAMSDEQFSELAVHKKDHPDNLEFREILSDPLFIHPKVDMSNLEDLM